MWRSRLAWIVTLVALVSAASARATVSVSLTANCSSPFGGDLGAECFPGSLVQLTARVTADAGEMDDSVFGAINVPIGQATGIGSSQVNLSTVGTAAPGWVTGNYFFCTTTFCTAFSQVNSNGPTAVGVTDFAISTVSFQLNPGVSVGEVINFNWRTTFSTLQRLDWFGLTNAPGTSVTVVVFPEPATGALLAMGLAGLALAARRRA